MAVLSDVDKVRLKTADKSAIVREEGEGDGISSNFQMEHGNLSTSPAPRVWVNSSIQTESTDYTVDYANGIITFAAPPAINDDLVFEYYWAIFNDDEVQAFLDDAGGNITVASARLLLAVAADAARVAKRQTLSGGSGIGSATIDTSVVARELRNTAQALLSLESDIANDVPVDQLTEVPWTEMSFRRMVDQDIIRNS